MILPTLLFGIDTTELMKSVLSMMPGIPAIADDVQLKANAELAVRPINRLRRD